MGLNIKNQRVHDLARQAAELRGTNQTSVIEEALVLLLAQEGVDPVDTAVQTRVERARDIAARYRADPAVSHGEGGPSSIEDLYDSHGLPR